MTDQLVNNKFKSNLRTELDKFAVDLALKHIRKRKTVDCFKFDDRWSVIKHGRGAWCVRAYNMITARDVTKSFSMCGIDSSLGDGAFESDDNFNRQ